MKIPCTKCSAMIMPSTAEKTGGLCMPCFKNPNRLEPSPIVEHVMKHPPRCLASFKAEPVDIPDLGSGGQTEGSNPLFKIGCQCGQSRFHVFGHYWQNPDTGAVLFVSPLSLKCESCGDAALFFDIKEHGYEGEQGDCWSARGEGFPERFNCEKCGPVSLEIFAEFEYPDDLFDEDFEEFRGREQDLFTWFSAYGRCSGCSKLLEVTDYECA